MHADAERPQRRRVVAAQLLVDDLGVGVRETSPAVLHRNVDARQTRPGQRLLQITGAVHEGIVTVGRAGDGVLALVVVLGITQHEPAVEEASHLDSQLLDRDHDTVLQRSSMPAD